MTNRGRTIDRYAGLAARDDLRVTPFLDFFVIAIFDGIRQSGVIWFTRTNGKKPKMGIPDEALT